MVVLPAPTTPITITIMLTIVNYFLA
jgi:hypothetical protein